MSNFDELVEIIGSMQPEAMRAALMKLAQRPMNASRRLDFLRVLSGSATPGPARMCVIAKGRVIPRSSLEALSRSPLLEYAPFIIKAALDPRGPFQSREIMMLAAEMKGGKAFYIKSKGIEQSHKNQAGYILSMAGFERVSHYDLNTRKPVKAWKVKFGYNNFTIEERTELVFSTIRQELGEFDGHAPKAAPAPALRPEDFI